jgi:hypothetical protein
MLEGQHKVWGLLSSFIRQDNTMDENLTINSILFK